MRRFRHPSRQDLQAWLDGSRPSLDDHLTTCDRCASTLEELEAPAEAPIGAILAEIYEAPVDLSERLTRRVTDRLDSRVMFDVVTDLFGAGLETSKLLLTEEPPDE